MTSLTYELYIDESDNCEEFSSYSEAYDKAEAYLEQGHQVYISYVDKHGEEKYYETL